MGLVAALLAGRIALAGDLLRGGAAAGARGGTVNPGTAADTTARARANAQDTLARTTLALRSVQALQAAALSAASASNAGKNPATGLQLPNVPDGLAPGGLQVDPGVPANPALWQGAMLPAQTNVNGQTVVNIRQTAPQAVLNWETFNIGRHTTLAIDQNIGGSQVGQWVAFNKVNDPSGIPSQILGSIQANGQVYVINRNGIIFGGASQVNTHIFVASALPINDTLVSAGLLNNSSEEFLFSSVPAAGFTLSPLPPGTSY
jgi:filamentous hemagglutinin family protein